MIKAVLFDFDDTLVITKVVRYEALKEAGRKYYDLDIKDEDIDKHWGKPLYTMLCGVYNNLESQEKLYLNYKSILGYYPFKPIKNTSKVIADLSKKYYLGIISSNNKELMSSGFNDVKLDPGLFNSIQSSDDTTFHKPDPEVFKPTLEKLKNRGVGKLEIIYIGDALDDFIAASNAGIHFCGIANRTVNENVFIQKNIPYIGNINSLPGYILKI